MDILKKFNLEGHDAKFYYQFLGRLRSDCEYYLGNGGRYHGHLWTKDEYDQIKLMRAIYKILPEPPEWLTSEQLDEYERRVLPQNRFVTTDEQQFTEREPLRGKAIARGSDDAFETFLSGRNDVIDNAGYALLAALAATEIEWNMEQIGTVIEDAEAVLAKFGIDSCHPFYEGDSSVPCVNGRDCKNDACPYRLAAEQK